MKKIYSLLGGLVLCGSVVAQSAYSNMPVKKRFKAKTVKNAKAPFTSMLGSTRNAQDAGAFNDWIEPVGDVMTTLNTIADQSVYLTGVFQDSTVITSDPTNGDYPIQENLIGSVLDLTSPNLASDYMPILTKNDPYMIDSLAIEGDYQKVTSSTDTLYVWLVWGDSTNTNVFSKQLDNAEWVAPISTWRHSVIGAKVVGATGGPGNTMSPAAPSTNKLLTKYVLTVNDSSGTVGYSKVIPIKLSSTVTIPAGNIVSCFYTFVPGGAYVANNCCFSFPGAPSAQNINGFCAATWGQSTPAVNSLADYENQEVDPNSWCMGGSYFNTQRHAVDNATFQGEILGDLVEAPLIYYHVTGTSTLGIQNLTANIASVSQNFPNPFSKITSVSVTLNKTSDVSLKVYNTVGQLVLVNNASKLSVGTHTMTIDAAKLASGMYFYTVKSGDYSVTHKMIVE